MKAKDVQVGEVYTAKVSGFLVPVRVLRERESFSSWSAAHCRTHYVVSNLVTGRETTFRSAAKLRRHVPADKVTEMISLAKRHRDAMKGGV